MSIPLALLAGLTMIVLLAVPGRIRFAGRLIAAMRPRRGELAAW